MVIDADIDFPEIDATRVPTVDECSAWARSENCGRTDCDHCGEDAAAWLCASARAGAAGIVALAREVNRACNASGGGGVTARDLARLRDDGRSRGSWSRSWAWAEGVLDAVSGRQEWLQRHDYEHDVDARSAYVIGRLLVELHLANEHLTRMEAQAMADADITSAAGVVSAPPTTPTLRARTLADEGPGWESRAQHTKCDGLCQALIRPRQRGGRHHAAEVETAVDLSGCEARCKSGAPFHSMEFCMHWLETALLTALVMAQSNAPHVNGSCLACQVAIWQWGIADKNGWDRLAMGCWW